MKIEIYTGGIAETNAYYLPEAKTLIDAPEGVLDHAQRQKWEISHLLMTHGHYDHIWDAAKIKEKTNCRVYYHQADEILFTNPKIWEQFGIPSHHFSALKADEYLLDNQTLEIGSFTFKLLHVPGHCAGSICFYEKKEKLLFGGDVLFAGGVGRWDLPGGSAKQLFEGIRQKIMVLPDDVKVYPGHGPTTTIGHERSTNPYLENN